MPEYVVPRIQAAGRETEPRSIAEQRYFTQGRIVVRGNQATRQRGKRADDLLRYRRGFPIALVEAKADYKKPEDGLQQAKDDAQILGLKFAYPTNGRGLVEFDFLAGLERNILTLPTPSDLWLRLRTSEKLTNDATAERFLTPGEITANQEPRYYQQIAISRAVQSILLGKNAIC